MLTWNKLKLSSGTEFHAPDFELLEMLCQANCIEWLPEPRLLRSGGSSRLYVHNRERLKDELSDRIGNKLYLTAEHMLRDAPAQKIDRRAPCFIGVPNAGTPLALAARKSSENWDVRRPNRPVAAMLRLKKMRRANERWTLVSPEPEHYKYFLVEDALTSGASLQEARAHLAEDGYPVRDMGCLAFIDRQQGGIERLREQGVVVRPLYHLLDILETFCEFKWWPEDICRAAREEILANQFA